MKLYDVKKNNCFYLPKNKNSVIVLSMSRRVTNGSDFIPGNLL